MKASVSSYPPTAGRTSSAGRSSASKRSEAPLAWEASSWTTAHRRGGTPGLPYLAGHPCRGTIRFWSRSKRERPPARNRGAQESRGEVLVFVDNDILVGPAFLARHVEVLSRARLLGDRTHGRLTRLRETPFGRFRGRGVGGVPPRSILGRGVGQPAGCRRRACRFRVSTSISWAGSTSSSRSRSCEDMELAMGRARRGADHRARPSQCCRPRGLGGDLGPGLLQAQRLYAVSDVLLWQKYGERSPREGLIAAHLGRPRGFGAVARRLAYTLSARWGGDRLAAAVVLGPQLSSAGPSRLLARCTARHRGSDPSRSGGRPLPVRAQRAWTCPVKRHVLHLIDASGDTAIPFPRAPRRGRRVPGHDGSVEPEGPLQEAMRSLGVPTFALGGVDWAGYMATVPSLARRIHRERVDVLHAHCSAQRCWGGRQPGLARSASSSRGTTRTTTLASAALARSASTPGSARHADRVIAVSEATGGSWRNVERVPSSCVSGWWF